MSKIQQISVHNLKAVSSLTVDFKGCTGIITGGNNKGKSTFLRTPIDRIRGTKPEIVLKFEEEEGFAQITLTTGEVFRWSFDSKTKAGEKLTFISKDNIKTSLTRAIADKYFPATFDVDKFLASQPKIQRKVLQELVGLDFTDIDKRYQDAFDRRTGANRVAGEEKVKFESIQVPEKIDAVDISKLLADKEIVRNKLNDQYKSNKDANDEKRKQWQEDCEKELRSVTDFNNEQSERTRVQDRAIMLEAELIKIGYTGSDVRSFIVDVGNNIQAVREYIQPTEPAYIQELPDNSELSAIDEQINTANETNRKAQLYADWISARDRKKSADDNAIKIGQEVAAIEKERMDLIKSAKMPEGFSFADDGILYNNLPFTREQLSSSGIYIAALKLAAMTLGEVKTLHFDASFLDRNSLEDIEKWAQAEGLQLLIERPDWDGGEIEYQLLNQS